jgi:hypothetical protein
VPVAAIRNPLQYWREVGDITNMGGNITTYRQDRPRFIIQQTDYVKLNI